MHDCAVVILNWNGLDFLKQFLPVAIRYSVGKDTALYVADNGSTDGSAEWIAENFSAVNLIKLNRNNGFARGYNLALEQINARYYVLLNSDVEVTEGWLKPLISCLESNPDIAACQPKIRSFYRRTYFEYGGAAGGSIDKYGYTFCRGRIFGFVEKDEGQYDNPEEIFWSSGACMAVRADAWKKCEGFDEDFFSHMEEVDLCWRLHRFGYRVSIVPSSVVYHIGGGMLPYESKFKTYLNFRNNLFLLYKNLPDDKLVKILFVRRTLDGLAALMFLLKGEFGNVLAVRKAHADYIKSLKRLKEKRAADRNLPGTDPVKLILNKSIVFEFYIKRNKTYSSVTTYK